MKLVRVAAVLLVLALTGPSVGTVVCDWTCAAQHAQSSSQGSCHQSERSGAALESAHRCHELAGASESILTATPQGEFRAIVVADAPGEARVSTLVLSVLRTSVRPNAPPPPLIPLRI